MIYLESNMEPYIGYHLASIGDYLCKGRQDLMNGQKIVSMINQLSMVLEAIETKRLKDRLEISLSPIEAIHILNLNLRDKNVAEEKNLVHLDIENISSNIQIIDNLNLRNLRVVIIKNYEIYSKCHFSVLKHKETLFDEEIDYLTLFLDEEFLNLSNSIHKNMVLRLIFVCMDHFITITSGISCDTLSEHRIISTDNFYDINLCPYIIFRNRLSTSDIMFISEYFVFLAYYLYRWFRVESDELGKMLWDFPLFELGNSTIKSDPFEIIYPAIKENINKDTDDLKRVMNCEYDVVECLRRDLMDYIYNED